MQDKEFKALIQGKVGEFLACQNASISTNLDTAISKLSDNIEDFVSLCKGELPCNHANLILKAIRDSFEEVYLRSLE